MRSEFAVHILNEGGISKASAIAAEFDILTETLESLCPVGRELSIVRTKLEEACFFAKKAMANDPVNWKDA